MPEACLPKFPCTGCGNSYTWKPELAGKKVKCKCGTVISVPSDPTAEPQNPIEETYDLVPSYEPPKPAKKATIPTAAIPAKSKPAALASGGGAASPVLGYRQPSTKNKENDHFNLDTLMDMKRDVYTPIVFLIMGMFLSVSYYAVHHHMNMTGVAVTTLGVSGMMLFKTVLLVGFALITAGPLGVSYGGIWTGILKLAAISVFSDGVVTWVEAGLEKGGAGGLSMLISYPVSIGVYWLLLIYLFSMEPGDSWMVVVLLSAFARIVQWVILFLLLNAVLNLSGSGIVSGGSSVNLSTADGEIATEISELDDSGNLFEYGKYKNDGHVLPMQEACDGMYAAGAKNIWYSVSRDINGKLTPTGIYVELPDDKTKRAGVYKSLNDFYFKRDSEMKKPIYVDAGSKYLKVPMFGSSF